MYDRCRFEEFVEKNNHVSASFFSRRSEENFLENFFRIILDEHLEEWDSLRNNESYCVVFD